MTRLPITTSRLRDSWVMPMMRRASPGFGRSLLHAARGVMLFEPFYSSAAVVVAFLTGA
jgi:hypothetical protein